jgi:hypothetical protein
MKRLCWRWLGVLAVLAVVLAIWLFCDDTPARLRLADGSELELRAITVGTNHQFRYGPPWQRALRVLPRPWEEKLTGRKVIQVPTAETSVVFWVTGDRPPPPRNYKAPRTRLGNPASAIAAPVLIPAALLDEGGVGVPTASFPFFSPATNVTLSCLHFPAWPRVSETLRLRFYYREPGETGHLIPVGEFTFPNPARRRTGPWTAEPLPITRRVEELSFTLLAARAGVNRYDPQATAPTPWEAAGFIRYRVEQDGQPSLLWSATEVECRGQRAER